MLNGFDGVNIEPVQELQFLNICHDKAHSSSHLIRTTVPSRATLPPALHKYHDVWFVWRVIYDT